MLKMDGGGLLKRSGRERKPESHCDGRKKVTEQRS
jgi:hypothetical protein